MCCGVLFLNLAFCLPVVCPRLFETIANVPLVGLLSLIQNLIVYSCSRKVFILKYDGRSLTWVHLTHDPSTAKPHDQLSLVVKLHWQSSLPCTPIEIPYPPLNCSVCRSANFFKPHLVFDEHNKKYYKQRDKQKLIFNC